MQFLPCFNQPFTPCILLKCLFLPAAVSVSVLLQAEHLEQELAASVETSRQWQQRSTDLEAQLQAVEWTAREEHQQLVNQSSAIVAQLEEARRMAAQVPQLEAQLRTAAEEKMVAEQRAFDLEARIDSAQAAAERELMGQVADLASQLEEARAQAAQVLSLWPYVALICSMCWCSCVGAACV